MEANDLLVRFHLLVPVTVPLRPHVASKTVSNETSTSGPSEYFQLLGGSSTLELSCSQQLRLLNSIPGR